MRRVVIDNDVTTVAAPAGSCTRSSSRFMRRCSASQRRRSRRMKPGYTGDTGRQLAEAARRMAP